MRNNFKKALPRTPSVPTVFLPGWGFDGRIIRLIQPVPAWTYPRTMVDPATLTGDLLSFVEQEQPGKIKLVGWSMGALLALDFAGRYPELVDELILISLRRDWPAAEVTRLHAELAKDPVLFMQDFYRKCFLGHREEGRTFSSTLARDYLDCLGPEKLDLLHRGLDYLGSTGIRPAAGPKTLLVHGSRDIIAPYTEMAELSGAAREIVDKAGHLPFLSPTCSLVKNLRKEIIGRRFSKAASSYDRYALVQKEAAGWLAARLPDGQDAARVRSILEIGCGTGNYTARLADRFPLASIRALDLSAGMIRTAAGKLRNHANIELVCVDAEAYLDSHEKPCDLITSNGTLQWFADLDRGLENCRRLLQADGWLLASIFGPESLKELNSGLREALGGRVSVAAAEFPDRPSLLVRLAVFFSRTEIEEIRTFRKYKNTHDLLRHIKKTGTGGWQQGGSFHFTKSDLAALDRWFTDNAGGCRVSYQVFIVQCKR